MEVLINMNSVVEFIMVSGKNEGSLLSLAGFEK